MKDAFEIKSDQFLSSHIEVVERHRALVLHHQQAQQLCGWCQIIGGYFEKPQVLPDVGATSVDAPDRDADVETTLKTCSAEATRP